MRRTARARDRIQRRRSVSVSLFPFLAVLICTMGALILLLVVIARRARLQAAEDTATENAEIREDLHARREWAQLEIDEYRYSREKTEAQLAAARLALGHVEDHARRLREQLARFEAVWSELENLGADGADRREELEAELKRVRDEIARSERELAEARRAAERRGSYAVVPYEGPHATHRRPIYIECRHDAVVLQPEGIALDEDDFVGPAGPGNPLDVALRAIREYLLRRRKIDPEGAGEPYPLLLVRPSGIEAYYAARAAMKSWASDFGYELIGEDWQLDFPPPDPELAEEVNRAVATARLRQKRLIAAAPRGYSRKSQAGYVPSPYRGGLVPQRGADDDNPDYQPKRPFGRFGNPFTSGGANHLDQASRPSGVAGTQTPRHEEPSVRPGRPARQHGDQTLVRSPSEGDDVGIGFAGGQPQSLAKVRGRNWGLPTATEASVPITSPIRIDCYPDRLVLVPEKGLGQPKVVPLGARTEDAIDALVSGIWQYIELWGSAGNGMYWRPVLNVHVAPGAQPRYADLKILLDGSGLEVKRNDE